MATNPITLLDGTTAYAHDVETKVNPLYTDIDDTNIRLGAAIQIKKLENLSSANIIVGSATNVPTAVAMTGDASISDTGVVTVTGGSSDEIAITNDTTTNATMYPVWVTAITGDLPAYVSSSKLSFNPSTGVLTATGFSGPLTGNVTGNLSGNATTASNLANGTYNYSSGSIIVDCRNALSAAACTDTHLTYDNVAESISQLWVFTAGAQLGLIRIENNHIYERVTNSDSGTLYLNYVGYSGGIGRFRDTVIGDGKGSPKVTYSGSADEFSVEAITLLNNGYRYTTDPDTAVNSYSEGTVSIYPDSVKTICLEGTLGATGDFKCVLTGMTGYTLVGGSVSIEVSSGVWVAQWSADFFQWTKSTNELYWANSGGGYGGKSYKAIFYFMTI